MANQESRAGALRAAGLVAALAVLVVGLRQLGLDDALGRGVAWVEAKGVLGMAVFVALYVGATVLFVPGSVLTMSAGAIWGVGAGTVVVSLGATLGATAAFLAGRYAARGWVAQKLEGSIRFAAIDAAVGREGWKLVLLTRLSPAFPFNLQNYAYGLTSVSLAHYFWSSWVGMLPGAVLYTYLGAVAGGLVHEQHSAAAWGLRAMGLAATVAATVFIARMAQRALGERPGG